MINATTVNPGTLARVLRRQAARLARFVPRARHGDVRGVHQARVASRRLREGLPIAGALAPEDAAGLRREVRRLTAALGAVRELDVATRVFEAAAAEAGWSETAVARVRRHLARARARQARRLRGRVGRVAARRIVARVEALAAALDEAAPQIRMDELLALRLRARGRRLAQALRAAGTLYVPAALHAVRIAGKKLRYSLELGRGVASLPVGRDIAKLRALQRTLGRLHDLQILQEHLKAIAADVAPERPATRALEAMAASFEAECRDLHAAFLRATPALASLTARAAGFRSADVAAVRRKRMARIRVHTAAPGRRAQSA
jgi:CHAD domain-containing protein